VRDERYKNLTSKQGYIKISWFYGLKMLPIHRVAGIQAAIILFGAIATLALRGGVVGEAMLAGGGVALSNTLMLAWRMRSGSRSVDRSAHGHLLMFYRSSLERFFVVGSLLAAGMGPLGFKPLPMLAGFVLGQLALIVSSLLTRRSE
jgi:ATP synthase protein I